VLIGVGINLYGAPEDQGTSIQDSLTFYQQLHNEKTQPIPSKENLAQAYLDRLFQSISDPGWRTAVKFRLAYRDSLVSLTDSWDETGSSVRIQGHLRGLDADGGLMLELTSGSFLKVTTGTLRPVLH